MLNDQQMPQPATESSKNTVKVYSTPGACCCTSNNDCCKARALAVHAYACHADTVLSLCMRASGPKAWAHKSCAAGCCQCAYSRQATTKHPPYQSLAMHGPLFVHMLADCCRACQRPPGHVTRRMQSSTNCWCTAVLLALWQAQPLPGTKTNTRTLQEPQPTRLKHLRKHIKGPAQSCSPSMIHSTSLGGQEVNMPPDSLRM
jgi:hypothetical protein